MSQLEEQWRELRKSLGLGAKAESEESLVYPPEAEGRETAGAWVVATIHLSGGPDIQINYAQLEEFSLDQDMIDATAFGETRKTYLTSPRRFTIRGRCS